MQSDPVQLPSESRYKYVQRIASGGYGHVYLFKTAGQKEPAYVAGKFIYRRSFGPPGDAKSEAVYQRAFTGLQNFRSITRESPYLLRVFEVCQRHDEGYFCYLMELADDIESEHRITPSKYKPRTLKNELELSGQRQRLPVLRCLEITEMLIHGLKILHEGGFTHRDVRPSNIIFVNGVPKLADIDLLAEHNATLTSYIPKHYAAPEGSHSVQADIFSLGKTIYEMLTGLPANLFPVLPPDVRHWEDHFTLLKMNRVIIKACERNPRKRYASAQQMLHDLEMIRA